jgi:hypothetical protein
MNNKVVSDIPEAYSITSHPSLPVYFTGTKSVVDVWPFEKDVSIGQFNFPSKDIIYTLKTNQSGD